jgi:hypothetical protein
LGEKNFLRRHVWTKNKRKKEDKKRKSIEEKDHFIVCFEKRYFPKKELPKEEKGE